MTSFNNSARIRTAVVADLAKRLPDRLGRTAVMKLIYFLQAVRGVNLGYSFRLYTYGPYDAQVIEDISIAELSGAVRSKEFKWARGTGYVLSPLESAKTLLEEANDELKKIESDLEWVATQFGQRNASELEVLSTLVFVDRATASSGQTSSIRKLAENVHEIKPHHSIDRICAEAEALTSLGLFKSIKPMGSAEARTVH